VGLVESGVKFPFWDRISRQGRGLRWSEIVSGGIKNDSFFYVLEPPG